MTFNPNDANRFPSPGNWLAEILAIIKADENFSPSGQIINEAKKPSLFMSNQFRYEPEQTRQLVNIIKSPPKGTYKGPLMDVVLSELKKLKKLKPGAERKFVRNAILQDFRLGEMHNSINIGGDKNTFHTNTTRGNWNISGKDWRNESQHTKYAGKFINSMKNLSKSRSLLGLGALIGVGIMAMGSIGNEA